MKDARSVPCGATNKPPWHVDAGLRVKSVVQMGAMTCVRARDAPVSSEALTMCGYFHKMSWLCLSPQNNAARGRILLM